MDFKEFVNKLEQDLKDAMADISPGATVDVRSVEKLQDGSYTGITISPAGGNVGMNLNANQLFSQMQDGQSYEGVLAVAVSTAERGLHDMPAVDVSELMNYEAAKKYLCCPVPIGFEQIDSGAKGYFHTVENRIALQEGMSQVQTIKTAIHEIS